MTKPATKDCFRQAFKLLTLGYSTVPSGSGLKGKFPLVKWKRYQEELPTEDDLLHWNESMHPNLWGVVTGELSDVVVIDTDSQEARSILDDEGLTPHVLTPRCANFWFRHPGYFVKTVAGVLPAIDVRGDRGFVNVTGTRGDGGVYRIAKWPVAENIYPWERLPTVIADAIKEKTKSRPAPVFTHVEGEDLELRSVTCGRELAQRLLYRALEKAVDGTRNDQGLWLGCQLRDNGCPQSQAEAIMLKYHRAVRNLDPKDPYSQDEALKSLEQAYSRPPRKPWERSYVKRYTYV